MTPRKQCLLDSTRLMSSHKNRIQAVAVYTKLTYVQDRWGPSTERVK